MHTFIKYILQSICEIVKWGFACHCEEFLDYLDESYHVTNMIYIFYSGLFKFSFVACGKVAKFYSYMFQTFLIN